MKKIKNTKDSQMKSEQITAEQRMELTMTLLKMRANRVNKNKDLKNDTREYTKEDYDQLKAFNQEILNGEDKSLKASSYLKK